MEWISVKDRLPFNGTRILIYCPIRGIRSWDFDTELYTNGFPTKLITHWMYLPKPPKNNDK